MVVRHIGGGAYATRLANHWEKKARLGELGLTYSMHCVHRYVLIYFAARCWLVIIALYKIPVQCTLQCTPAVLTQAGFAKTWIQPPRKLHTATEEPEQGTFPLSLSHQLTIVFWLKASQAATYLVSKQSHPVHVF